MSSKRKNTPTKLSNAPTPSLLPGCPVPSIVGDPGMDGSLGEASSGTRNTNPPADVDSGDSCAESDCSLSGKSLRIVTSPSEFDDVNDEDDVVGNSSVQGNTDCVSTFGGIEDYNQNRTLSKTEEMDTTYESNCMDLSVSSGPQRTPSERAPSSDFLEADGSIVLRLPGSPTAESRMMEKFQAALKRREDRGREVPEVERNDGGTGLDPRETGRTSGDCRELQSFGSNSSRHRHHHRLIVIVIITVMIVSSPSSPPSLSSP